MSSSAAAAAQLTASPVSKSSSNNNTTTAAASESNLIIIQDMIDLSANHLDDLRTQCATSATLTQQQIRGLESKLVRYFSELLLTKSRLNERIPANGLLPHHQATGNELRQWLRVVGLSQESLNVCLGRLKTLEQTLQLSDDELKQLLAHNTSSSQLDEELRRLTKAMHNLRKCMEKLESNNSAVASNADPDQWHWDSWDRPHPQPHHTHRGSIGNIGLGLSLNNASPRAHHRHHHQHQHPHGNGKPKAGSSSASSSRSEQHPQSQQQQLTSSQMTLTLTPSPPNSPFTPASGTGGSLSGTPQRSRSTTTAAGTPPPAKKHQTLLMHNSSSASDTAVADQPPRPPRSRLPTDPSPDSHSSASSSDIFVDACGSSSNVLLVPPSPVVAHVGMGHTIKHRFNNWYGFMTTCKLCQKQMLRHGLKCTDCKYTCHKSCAQHVPPSCGLPPEYVYEFRQTQVGGRWDPSAQHSSSSSKASPVPRKSTLGSKPQLQQPHQLHHGDSSSPSSSCTSSTPSSPALFQHQQQQQQQLATPNACQPKPPQQQNPQSQFNFPNVTITCNSNASAAQTLIISNETTLSSSSSTATTETLTNGNNNSGINNSNNCSNNSCYNSSGSNNSGNYHNNNSSGNSSSSIIMSSSCGSNNSSNGHSALIGSQMSTHSISSSSQTSSSQVSSSSSATYTASLVNSGSFFPRKLSNAGVDKRTPFTSEYTDTHKSNDSDKTVSLSGSASTDSDRTPVRLDSTEDGDSGQWRQNSISLKEWDIPYGDLHLMERIGQGRFGTVHRALWHGDVAVKLLNEDYLQDEHMLESFRNEVANFKKTRHENLVLFMGACMNPPYLAIVTSLCKGNTLYTYIHQRREKFAMNRTLLIAQQIAQGMGYLHARDIIHKDLRTKNIFIENGKVIITDFGLFSSTKLLYCDMGLGVPQNWLCYLAPELIRALQPRKPPGECLEFTPYSDVYSFGTVWYELICGEFTFKDQPAESIIWQVGRGMKQSLANLQSGRDVKDLLMLCWTYKKEDRPDFARLLSLLEHLPKKRLARSPSHPVNLSRSAESVF
ncbi:kinase suppressor of Ras 2 [Drosophila grimshawi]|uniref:GH18995 n=1 Tax=Drosophila grimshawi TaxID=7222 RepID=B4JHV4_DROGR|nr:kinase suppressor of Ras 2 [Drosophila grimshawi]EDV92862.1 GH18995 [Drosophila grimshawi]